MKGDLSCIVRVGSDRTAYLLLPQHAQTSLKPKEEIGPYIICDRPPRQNHSLEVVCATQISGDYEDVHLRDHTPRVIHISLISPSVVPSSLSLGSGLWSLHLMKLAVQLNDAQRWMSVVRIWGWRARIALRTRNIYVL
jgi:hypothetical protein